MPKLNIGDSYSVDVIVETIEGKPYVALRDLSIKIGMPWNTTYKVVSNNPLFQTKAVPIKRNGKETLNVFLPIEQLTLWLCNVNADRVKPEIRPHLLQMQKDCQKVMFNAL